MTPDVDAGLDARTDHHPWSRVNPPSCRRIVAAAVDAFSENGYHATSTRDIAARAGLSAAALYVHYPSKAALLAQISTLGHLAMLDLVQDSLTGSAAAGADVVGRLRALVRDFVTWHAVQHQPARVIQYEWRALPEPTRSDVAALRRTAENVVEELILDGVRTGLMDVAEPRRVARAILSLGVDVARWYDPSGPDTPASLGELYGDLAVRMVGGRPVSAAARPTGSSEGQPIT